MEYRAHRLSTDRREWQYGAAATPLNASYENHQNQLTKYLYSSRERRIVLTNQHDIWLISYRSTSQSLFTNVRLHTSPTLSFERFI